MDGYSDLVACPRCGMQQEPSRRCISCGELLAAPAPAAAVPAEDNPFAAPEAAVDREASYVGSLEPAGRLMRLAAWLVDSLLEMACTIPGVALVVAAVGQGGESGVPLLVVGTVLMVVGVLGIWIYQWMLLAREGQSVGKKVVSIRIVRAEDGGNPGFGKAVALRNWVRNLITNVPYLGFIFFIVDIAMIFGAERRCIHDHLAGTIVVRV